MKLTTKNLCLTAIFMALTFVITRFIQIPIPLGYFNVGNSIILLSCLVLPSPLGIISGSIGSALADLTSFPIYTIPTLIIKAAMPLVFYRMTKANINKPFAVLVSTLIPLIGYTLCGAFFYGGFAAGLTQLPGLALEYIGNFVLFAVFAKPFMELQRRNL